MLFFNKFFKCEQAKETLCICFFKNKYAKVLSTLINFRTKTSLDINVVSSYSKITMRYTIWPLSTKWQILAANWGIPVLTTVWVLRYGGESQFPSYRGFSIIIKWCLICSVVIDIAVDFFFVYRIVFRIWTLTPQFAGVWHCKWSDRITHGHSTRHHVHH